jgi:NAD(P)H-hydrate epimerase
MKMKAVSSKEIRALDSMAINDYGIPSLALMENAGRSVAVEVLKDIRNKPRPRVCIVCGLGNNAGDGFVAARHLSNNDIKTSIYLIGQVKNLKQDAAVNCLILKKCGYPIKEIQKVDKAFRKEIHKAEVIVDAIFGVGLSREIKDPYKAVIEALNQSGRPIVSVDVPSGLDATTGNIYGTCIKAKKTVTFTLAKSGFFRNKGPECTGRIIVTDIGIPKIIHND